MSAWTASYECPHCGETLVSSVDPGGGRRQEYVEDCHVCCRPNLLTVRISASGSVEIRATPEDA